MAKSHRNFLWVNRNLSWSTFFVMGPIFDIGAGYILSGVLDQVVLSCMLMFLGCQIESRETLARLRRLDNCCTWTTIKTNKLNKQKNKHQTGSDILDNCCAQATIKTNTLKKHQSGSENLDNCCAWATIKTNKLTNKKTNTSQAHIFWTIAALGQP